MKSDHLTLLQILWRISLLVSLCLAEEEYVDPEFMDESGAPSNGSGLSVGTATLPLTTMRTTKSPAHSLLTCTQPMFESGESFSSTPNQFVNTWHNSRYLIPKVEVLFSAGEVGKLCRSLDLEPAVLDTLLDFVNMENFTYGRTTAKGQQFGLGGVFTSPGVLVDVNVRKPFRFQAFDFEILDTPFSTSYYNPGKRCLAMSCYKRPADMACHYSPVDCQDDKVIPLCQYPRRSACFQSLPFGQFAAEEKDEIFPVGMTSTKMFFGGRKQKTWEGALEKCAKEGLQLFSFNRWESVDDGRKVISQVIENYRSNEGFRTKIPSWMGLSWIGGRFTEGVGVNKPIQFDDGLPWTMKNVEEFGFKWAVKDVQNPKDETCLVLLHDGFVRPVVCNMKHFYICWARRPPPAPSNTSTSTSTTTTEPPPTETETTTKSPAAVNNDKITQCDGAVTKVVFTNDGIPPEVMVSLVVDSINYGFRHGYASGMKIKPESSWRVAHVTGMGKMTKHTCSGSTHVSPAFINVLKNLIMLYYNSYPELGRGKDATEFWEKQAKQYSKCYSDTSPPPFRLAGEGDLATSFSTAEGGTEKVKIRWEKADDKFEALDFVLEGLWFMFQVTAATCHGKAELETSWLAEYFYNFRNDWTFQFQDLWAAHSGINFGVMFGDVELSDNLYNLRACAAAAFETAHIGDRLMVRPLLLGETFRITEDLNERVAGELVDPLI